MILTYNTTHYGQLRLACRSSHGRVAPSLTPRSGAPWISNLLAAALASDYKRPTLHSFTGGHTHTGAGRQAALTSHENLTRPQGCRGDTHTAAAHKWPVSRQPPGRQHIYGRQAGRLSSRYNQLETTMQILHTATLLVGHHSDMGTHTVRRWYTSITNPPSFLACWLGTRSVDTDRYLASDLLRILDWFADLEKTSTCGEQVL